MKNRLAALLAAPLLLTSCLGPDRAYNSLKTWNAELSENDVVVEATFLALNVIPVYGLALFADHLVLNTIDYWTGENPVDEPKAFPEETFSAK